ncbi:MAG: phospho-sugar mutase [Clostridia bacterium]|nr:phospho-sugar mutase [Clostridia bacterium]
MDYMKIYDRWLSSVGDGELKSELRAIAGDEDEIKARFGRSLEFGTAGLRGIMGAGTSRMNIYTVGHATQAMAKLVVSCGREAMERGVCIAFDSRSCSALFARRAACVLAANGVKAYLFDALRPTPELSFAVRYRHAIAGIIITASHNPKEYNGYKAYWEDGAQMSLENSKKVSDIMAETDMFTDVKTADFDAAVSEGKIVIMGRETDEAYLNCVLSEAVDTSYVKKAGLKVVYTPFHGAGYKLVPEVMERIGVERVVPVREQFEPDGAFPTVKSPNPENPESFALAKALAVREGADIVIGTDPDSDRIGVLSPRGGEWRHLNGNQVGVVLLDYIIKGLRRSGRMPAHPAAIKTIVSSELFRRIAEKNGVALFEVLTGFKFIGEKILEFEKTGGYDYIFGYEESYGYLKGTYCRDKDAVVASMLVCEAAAYYKTRGMTLWDALDEIYEEYGCSLEGLINVTDPKFATPAEMGAVMAGIRANAPESIGGFKVTAVRDYKKGTRLDAATGEETPLTLPKSDVLYYELCDGSRFIMRPSGTEPKVKIYFLVSGRDMDECRAKLEAFREYGNSLLK